MNSCQEKLPVSFKSSRVFKLHVLVGTSVSSPFIRVRVGWEGYISRATVIDGPSHTFDSMHAQLSFVLTGTTPHAWGRSGYVSIVCYQYAV